VYFAFLANEEGVNNLMQSQDDVHNDIHGEGKNCEIVEEVTLELSLKHHE
jgi:hypothetical protein